MPFLSIATMFKHCFSDPGLVFMLTQDVASCSSQFTDSLATGRSRLHSENMFTIQ